MTANNRAARARKVLEDLQEGLEHLYRLAPAPLVSDFLVEGDGQRREQLTIIEEDELYLGVSIDRAARARLLDQRLASANLNDFCLVVEGVSHFLFVIHRARERRSTTILELELQAEVDKYVASLMLTERCPSLPSETLRQRLYDDYRLVDGLSPAERHRYHRANALARRYARRLERRFVQHRRLPAMLGELRRFYRMDYWAKEELIDRAA